MENDSVTFERCESLSDGTRVCSIVDAPEAAKGDTVPVSDAPDMLAWARPILDDPAGWAQANLLNLDILLPIAWQIAAIIGTLFVGIILAPGLRKLITSAVSRLPGGAPEGAMSVLPKLVRPALWAGLLYAAQAAMANAGLESTLVRIASSLALAGLLVRVVTTFLQPGLRKPAGWVIWIFAGLYAFGIHDEVFAWLSSVGPPFGDRIISPVFVVQAILTAALFLFAAHWLAKKLKTRVDDLPRVEPSLRILMSNALHIGLFIAAAMLTLAGLGIPTSGLAVLGGAIGVGLGFGMQQIVANFISGVILLTDRSIKPDDVIEVDDTYGVVKSLGLRYASVITRDGKEHLIPNEQLITDTVVNWSYSNKQVRIKRRLRVEYETDLRTACRLVVEGVSAIDRVLSDPAPKCLVMEFGEEAVELEARFWISDPENGVSNVGSDAMLSVWDRFKENGIDIPLRHEDVLITPGSTLKVEMVKGSSGSGD